MTTTLEQWQSGRSIEGVPPFDGTGVPLPVDDTGWPVVPGDGAPAEPGEVTILSFTAQGVLSTRIVQAVASAISVPPGATNVGRFRYEAVDGVSLIPAESPSNYLTDVPFAAGYAPVAGDTLDLIATWVPNDPAAWTAPTATVTSSVFATQEEADAAAAAEAGNS